MKITLVKATFYFNGPIYLTPSQRELAFELKDVSDDVVRSLHLAINSGVVEVIDGQDELTDRLETIKASKNKDEIVKEEVKKQEVETKEEVKVEVKEEVVDTPKEPVVKKAKPTNTKTTKKA